MYEMMAGRPPYDGESPVAVAIQHINGGAAMPSTLNPNIPGGMEQIIMKGMSLDAKDRYLSATEMLRDMDEFRKDPGILFRYEKPRISDMTQPISFAETQKTRTTADRVAGGRSGSMSDSGRIRMPESAVRRPEAAKVRTGSGSPAARPRTTSDPARQQNPHPANRTVQRRKSRQEIAQEERRSRITTMAIVACSAVAVFAIAVFLIALSSGALFDQEQDLVSVPNLVGKVWAPVMDGFTVEQSDPVYSDVYAPGEIMHQTPTADSRVEKGSVIYVNVSLGPEPDTIAYLINCGAKVSETQVVMNERTAGESYLTLTKTIRYMTTVCSSILFLQWFRKREL
jgi:serine/threonine-protein kinase